MGGGAGSRSPCGRCGGRSGGSSGRSGRSGRRRFRREDFFQCCVQAQGLGPMLGCLGVAHQVLNELLLGWEDHIRAGLLLAQQQEDRVARNCNPARAGSYHAHLLPADRASCDGPRGRHVLGHCAYRLADAGLGNFLCGPDTEIGYDDSLPGGRGSLRADAREGEHGAKAGDDRWQQLTLRRHAARGSGRDTAFLPACDGSQPRKNDSPPFTRQVPREERTGGRRRGWTCRTEWQAWKGGAP